MDQEEIDRSDCRYRALAELGLFAARFAVDYSHPPKPQKMDFMMTAAIDPEIAKRAVRKFLEDTYQATDIKFYRQGASQNHFYTTFMRGDI